MWRTCRASNSAIPTCYSISWLMQLPSFKVGAQMLGEYVKFAGNLEVNVDEMDVQIEKRTLPQLYRYVVTEAQGLMIAAANRNDDGCSLIDIFNQSPSALKTGGGEDFRLME